MISVTFQPYSVAYSGTIIVSAFEDRTLSASAKKLDLSLKGALTRAMATQGFSGKAQEVCLLLAPTADIDQVVIVGLGKESTCTPSCIEESGGCAFTHLHVQEALVLLDPLSNIPHPELSFAEGMLLRSWAFDKYRTVKPTKARQKLETLRVATANPGAAQKTFASCEYRIQGVLETRALVAEPANVLFPASFATRAQEVLAPLGVHVEILGKKKLEQLGMGALLGVAQGSTHDPSLVVLEWNGTPKNKTAPIAFVGKGLTFDSGGIDLKPQKGMEEMIHDMAGAGAVFGLFKTLALRKARVHAVGILGLAENMPSGSAQRPGDIVKTLSGKTVHILNTDAEGRLVLADALWYTCDRFKPRILIDLATLTGSIVSALGTEFAGLFSNDEQLATHLIACGNKTGEKLWRLPMTEKFDKDIDSDVADVKNLGTSGEGGSITAAQFLKRFIKEPVAWAHLDIAGTAWTRKDSALAPKGATGFGVRLLDALVQEYEAA
ncbi:MAG: leucyl aminopeptidase [Holosporales bacterium]|jgi:leucyl aminopeptidase|nr:leucyl aminopeptidase [Holosporales bacterium]